MSKKKKKKRIKYSEIELNLMPFIDAFSILVTFLLMSAVFVTLGIIEVQIPFLAPPSKDIDKPTRSLGLKVDMEKDKIQVITSYSLPPIKEAKKTYKTSDVGLSAMHKYLVEIRKANPKLVKVEFYTEDNVLWEDIARALDSIKLRRDGDPIFMQTEVKKDGTKVEVNGGMLFPKVVLSSVML